uniref:Caveolin n=1 Tax=Sinocyclocheilus grahami TaxID=75366 RepID=A0A672K7G3_SINGR
PRGIVQAVFVLKQIRAGDANFLNVLFRQVSFEDVIAEPVSVRSGDRVWIWSHALFEVSRAWFYRIITALLAVPVSLLAGILFAVLSFVHIWYDSVLDIIILPFFQSIAKCCSGISVVLTRE